MLTCNTGTIITIKIRLRDGSVKIIIFITIHLSLLMINPTTWNNSRHNIGTRRKCLSRKIVNGVNETP